MPKTSYFSDREKRRAMNLLDIHDDIIAVRLLTSINQRTLPRRRKKLPGRRIATLSEKSFPMSDKRTMSAKLLTNQQQSDTLTLTPDPSIQPPPGKQRSSRRVHLPVEIGF